MLLICRTPTLMNTASAITVGFHERLSLVSTPVLRPGLRTQKASGALWDWHSKQGAARRWDYKAGSLRSARSTGGGVRRVVYFRAQLSILLSLIKCLRVHQIRHIIVIVVVIIGAIAALISAILAGDLLQVGEVVRSELQGRVVAVSCQALGAGTRY